MTDVLDRLKALDAERPNIPLPKGPVPTSMKGMRGRTCAAAEPTRRLFTRNGSAGLGYDPPGVPVTSRDGGASMLTSSPHSDSTTVIAPPSGPRSACIRRKNPSASNQRS